MAQRKKSTPKAATADVPTGRIAPLSTAKPDLELRKAMKARIREIETQRTTLLTDDVQPTAFTFNEAQAFFGETDLRLPSGDTVDILRQLYESLGKVVKHAALDPNSNQSNASEILRGRIADIHKAFKCHRVPYRIEAKRGVGYVLRSQLGSTRDERR